MKGGGARILVIDDDPSMREALSDLLSHQGYEVSLAADGDSGLALVATAVPALVLLDVKLPNRDGMDVLKSIRLEYPDVPVIMLTGHGDIRTAVRAIQGGAYDYLTKPFDAEDLLGGVARAVERQQLLAEVRTLRQQLGQSNLAELMGGSAAVQRLGHQVRAVAQSTLTVVIQGETGSGKELVARAVHQQSPRRERPFVALDCGAIAHNLIESELFGHERGAFTGADRARPGHFQRTAGGTMFLDEIANLPLATQATLLRVLQERQVQRLGGGRPEPVDVRVVAACNASLEAEIAAGRFRQDLYYRLNEFTITVPPLRERPEDIPYLAKRFLAQAVLEFDCRVSGISEEAMGALIRHPWPGNVRELRNVIRRAALVGQGSIGGEHLDLEADSRPPAAVPRSAGPLRSLRTVVDEAVIEAERAAISQAIRVAGGNKTEAARLLNINSKTLYLKMKHYGLSG